MGKKRQPSVEDEEEEEEKGLNMEEFEESESDEYDSDEELEAEMKALESIQADRRKQQHSNHPSHSSHNANKIFVNNKAGLKQSLEDFQWTNKAKWFDHLVIVGENREEKLETVDDDLTRETFFYERALESANQVVKKLKKLGVPVKRPHDYYAEMVKSDEHMKKVRSELMYEQQQLEIRDERRKTREAKRYGKQVQAEKVKQRTLAKKEAIKDLDKWRLQRKKSGFADDGKAPFEVSGGDAKRKRETRDSKFGFGGKKRGMKRNDKNSARDMSDYRPASFDRGGNGKYATGSGGRKSGKGKKFSN
mmetsp:Transcript_10707/g.30431  ORF Transcript_10707/g.30431 Transcript_10707/m.30431 type:complete len:306 (-) Transcript_10707:35-952(-)